MKLDAFGKVALGIIITSAVLLVAFYLWQYGTKIEWKNHLVKPVLKEEVREHE